MGSSDPTTAMYRDGLSCWLPWLVVLSASAHARRVFVCRLTFRISSSLVLLEQRKNDPEPALADTQ